MKLDKQQEAQSAVGDSISSVGVPVTVKEYPPSEVFTNDLLPVSFSVQFNSNCARVKNCKSSRIKCDLRLELCVCRPSKDVNAAWSDFLLT